MRSGDLDKLSRNLGKRAQNEHRNFEADFSDSWWIFGGFGEHFGSILGVFSVANFGRILEPTATAVVGLTTTVLAAARPPRPPWSRRDECATGRACATRAFRRRTLEEWEEARRAAPGLANVLPPLLS